MPGRNDESKEWHRPAINSASDGSVIGASLQVRCPAGLNKYIRETLDSALGGQSTKAARMDRCTASDQLKLKTALCCIGTEDVKLGRRRNRERDNPEDRRNVNCTVRTKCSYENG